MLFSFIMLLLLTSSVLPYSVLLTREAGKNENLRDKITALRPATKIIELPVVKTLEVTGGVEKVREILAAGGVDLVTITSPEAAAKFIDAAVDCPVKLPSIASVGSGTSEILQKNNLRVDFVPSKAMGKTLGDELPIPTNVMGIKKVDPTVLYPCSSLAQDTLQKALETRGFRVERVETYSTQRNEWGESEKSALPSDDNDLVVTFASPSSVKNFLLNHPSATRPKAVCIGETSGKCCVENGWVEGVDVFWPGKPGVDAWGQLVCDVIDGRSTQTIGAATETTQAGQSEKKRKNAKEVKKTSPPPQSPPFDLPSLIRQVKASVLLAQAEGIARQEIRTPLPRSKGARDLGRLYEGRTDGYDTELVPTDETWQGGIMQLYRAATPVVNEILRAISDDVGGIPVQVEEDRSIDESGVDGVGVFKTACDPEDEVCAVLQPTQEVLPTIIQLSESVVNEDQLLLLFNPQWRNVDDALDSASKSGGLFGGLASILGGKGKTLEKLDELGFELTYCLDGYVCKGNDVWLLKTFMQDWRVFAETGDGSDYIFVGTKATRPNYQDVEEMLTENGIKEKFARDIGL